MSKSKYIKESDIKVKIDINCFTPETTDNILEGKILKAIVDTRKAEEFYCVAAQLAVVGYGQKKFETYRYNGKPKSMTEFMRSHNIRSDFDLGSDLKEDQLTPRRLIRIFRFHIKKYLEANPGQSSYFFRKYTPEDDQFRTTCFPGSEHLVTTQDEADYLLNGYANLDRQLSQQGKVSGIIDRIKRVLRARKFEVSTYALESDSD